MPVDEHAERLSTAHSALQEVLRTPVDQGPPARPAARVRDRDRPAATAPWSTAGLARSRGQAQELIKAGRVALEGRTELKASDLVADTDLLEARTDPYVSRGAHKLAGALDDLGLVPAGRALDAGSSTGGFTQVLLERGAEQVYAVDVGTEQLAAPLRADPRVRRPRADERPRPDARRTSTDDRSTSSWPTSPSSR